MATLFTTREAYLSEAVQLILDEKIMPCAEALALNLPKPPVRVSVGFPKHTRSKSVIAQCFVRRVSTDGFNEIFVTPELDDPIEVLDAVVHECVHAYDDCDSGHKGTFARLARKVGLEGKLTATHAGAELRGYLQSLVDLLGDYPHHRMDVDIAHKKGGTRMLKIECSECGFVARTSQKWIDELPADAACPVCDSCSLNAV